MLHLLFATLWISAAAGCAHPAHPTAATNQDFHEIQVQENRISEAQAIVRKELSRHEPDCKRVCAHVGKVCDAADDLCSVATSMDDADANTRCELGRASCREDRTRAGERCKCPRAPKR